MAKVSPMEIYRLLPGTNCKECGDVTCMAFASSLIERNKKIGDCAPLFEDKFKENLKKLLEMMTPPVKEVTFGTGEKACSIGGEEVMFRHELTFFNQAAFIIDIHDEMTDEEIAERVNRINHFSVERIGQELRLQGIAIRSKSDDPTKFGNTVISVIEKTDMPLVICSLRPELLEVALEIALEKSPLIYAATEDNLGKIGELALKYKCPVVASSPGDIQGLIDITTNLMERGVEDIVLDIGTYTLGEKFGEMLDNLVSVRRLAIEEKVKELGFPILGVPLVAWLAEKDPILGGVYEATLAATQTLRYCDALIIHSLEMWEILPLLTLRQNVYTDPRVPIMVDPGLYEIGSPDKNSPMMMTTNFALTYYTVASDLEASKISCYLLVVDTDGLAVEPAMAGAKLTAGLVKETLDSAGANGKIKNKSLIIPGMVARISGELEEETGWEVVVGPIDSSRIKGFLDSKSKKN
ncbi:MAG: acetyl-CoA decarbonylase/synthase complex subunit gamma [Candidatus Hydrothermarchaeaceae archaeon]